MTILLAIDPGTRETGWAVFSKEPQLPDQEHSADESTSMTLGSCPLIHPLWSLVETGVIIAYHRLRRVEVAERIKDIREQLTRVADRWHPKQVACAKPSVPQLPQQQAGVVMLTDAMEQWAQGYKLSPRYYTFRSIRLAISGRANAAKEELAYAVMTRWGLLGEGKTTHERNAIAVRDYHLEQCKTEEGIEK